MLRQPQAVHELAHQQRLLDRREGAHVGARQHAEQALGQVTRPTLHPRGVAAEPAQGGNAPIAIDQHQTFGAVTGLGRGIGHRNARDDLAAALDRTGELLHRARLHQAGAGKAQIQAMQVEIQPRRVHPARLAALPRRSYHVLSLQTSSARPYRVETKVISTRHASIFANSAAVAGRRVHLCEPCGFRRSRTLPAITLPLPGPVAIALAVLWVRAPVLAPVFAMALRPCTLCPCLVLAIIGVAGALGLLPDAPSLPLAGGSTAIMLLRNLRTRPECLAAARTSPALHGCISAQEPARSTSAAAGRILQPQRDGTCNPRRCRPPVLAANNPTTTLVTPPAVS